MSLKRPLPSDFCSTEIEEVILPEEVLIQIWTYLDFKTVQKTCTRVSKSWFEMIRNSKLSWEMKLRNTFYFSMDIIGVKEFNAMLFHWKSLRLLHFSCEADFDKFRLILDSHKSLEKIMIPSGPSLYTKGVSFERTLWGWVTEYWIDPSELLTPTDTIKKVITLEISLKCLSEEFDMTQNDWDLTDLENLIVSQSMSYETAIPEPELLLRFKNLKTLQIGNVEIRINYLLDILRFLENTINVQVYASVEVTSHLDAKATKDIFKKAYEIANKKFPYPDFPMDLHIFEIPLSQMEPRYSIRLSGSGAMLTTNDSDSEAETETEMDTSDSMDDSIESSGSVDESVESSDSMNESIENSNSMNESVNSSDTEDINA